MFRKDPTAITFNYSLTAADALAIRNAAKAIVFDDLLMWNIGTYDAMASFTYTTLDSADFAFTSTSTNANSYFWDFGDGNTSTLANPTNSYSNFGDYIVTLSVFNCGDTSTVSDTITAYVVNTTSIIEDNLFRLSPNPTNGIINIRTNIHHFNVQIYNEIGQLILETQSNEIDISNQPKGIYFINIEYDGKKYESKF